MYCKRFYCEEDFGHYVDLNSVINECVWHPVANLRRVYVLQVRNLVMVDRNVVRNALRGMYVGAHTILTKRHPSVKNEGSTRVVPE